MKILGFQSKGGILLKNKYIYDDDIVTITGKKGYRKLMKKLLTDVTYLKLGKLVCYSAEDVLAEVEEKIDIAILENQYRV